MTKPPKKTTAAPPRAKARRFLLIRYGGQGDALFLTPVAEELRRRGWQVHIAVNDQGHPLVQHLPFVHSTYLLRREPVMQTVPQIPGHPCDLISWRGGLVPVEAVYPQFPSPGPEYGPWAVCNYRFVIESNSLHPWINRGQNSNFINTYDMHFSWAGIDPISVPAEFRRPRYVVTAQERAAAVEAMRNLPRPVYLVQPLASSPARTYFRPAELYKKMVQLTKGTVLLWNGQNWETGGRPFPLPVVEGSTPMRASAAMVEQADLVISADTAISHIAEALSVRSLVFYSTVPAWTRSRDYLYSESIDLAVPDSQGRGVCKCGVIARDCPRVAAEAIDTLTDRQRELVRLLPPDQQAQLGLVPPMPLDTGGRLPMEHFRTTANGLQSEVQAAATQLDGARQRLAHCLASLDLWPHVERKMKEIE